MNVKIRNAVPDDAAAIQKIIAAGYRQSCLPTVRITGR